MPCNPTLESFVCSPKLASLERARDYFFVFFCTPASQGIPKNHSRPCRLCRAFSPDAPQACRIFRRPCPWPWRTPALLCKAGHGPEARRGFRISCSPAHPACLTPDGREGNERHAAARPDAQVPPPLPGAMACAPDLRQYLRPELRPELRQPLRWHARHRPL